jgi:hypothetical protein
MICRPVERLSTGRVQLPVAFVEANSISYGQPITLTVSGKGELLPVNLPSAAVAAQPRPTHLLFSCRHTADIPLRCFNIEKQQYCLSVRPEPAVWASTCNSTCHSTAAAGGLCDPDQHKGHPSCINKGALGNSMHGSHAGLCSWGLCDMCSASCWLTDTDRVLLQVAVPEQLLQSAVPAAKLQQRLVQKGCTLYLSVSSSCTACAAVTAAEPDRHQA